MHPGGGAAGVRGGGAGHRAPTRPRLKASLEAVDALSTTPVLFADACHLLDRSAPISAGEPLTRTDALPFALTTFSTAGFGDIAARSWPGRVPSMPQMMTGGLLLVGVAAQVPADTVRAGPNCREPSHEPRSGTDAGTPDREAGS